MRQGIEALVGNGISSKIPDTAMARKASGIEVFAMFYPD
jgi:hypothetical protein